jgi:5-oxopent-3-ene-1,2,5-tricarboxylate decarboxylase/2-hydroxyhepta-2,4-diene-1,7-dioate isomerase
VDLTVATPPWRLSGVVVGAALNDPRTLEALGGAVDAPPHRGAPKAPVLYVKPRHTLADAGAPMVVPRGVPALEAGVTVAVLVGQVACRVSAQRAHQHIAAWALALDLGVPLTGWYRPGAPARALDASLHLGAPVAASAPAAAPVFELRAWVDDRLVQHTTTAGFVRDPARLLADVSDFMTLSSGDLLLLGVPHGAPLVRAGQRVRVACEGLGEIETALVADAA